MALGEMATHTQEQRDLFYRNAENYVPTATESALRIPRVQWLRALHNRTPFKSILDLGCNDGFSTRWALDDPHVNRVVGIDLNERAIVSAKALKEEQVFPEVGEYYCASFFDWCPEEQFEVVVAFELLEHFLEPEARRLLEMIHSRLAVGGTAVMSTPNVNGIWGRSNPDPTHIFLLSATDVAALMKDVLGVEVTVHDWADILHWSWRKTE